MNATLSEAERILGKYSHADFDTTVDAAPECIDVVRVVEASGAWAGEYGSLEAFYVAHEDTHPDIRLYAQVRREIETSDPLTSPGGTIAVRIERLRRSGC